MSSTKVEENGAGTRWSPQPPHKSTICIRKHSRHGVNSLQVHKIQKTQTADTERVRLHQVTMNGVTGMSIKCVLVGDNAVGKTALLVRFTSETFPESYRPTVFDNTGVEVYMDGVHISLGLWDTAGNDTFQQIRPRSYQQADIVLICYSVANPNSLANVHNKWLPEVREYLPNVPVLVVATQTDLREMGAYRGNCTTSAEGAQMAREIKAKGYVECSAFSNRGVQQVFEYAVRIAVNQAKKQARRRMFRINQCKVF